MHEPRICLRIASLSWLYPDERVFHLRQEVVKIPREAGGNRVPRRREDDRDNRCRLPCCEHRASQRDDDIDLETNELGCNLGEAFGASFRPAILDRNGASPDQQLKVPPPDNSYAFFGAKTAATFIQLNADLLKARVY